MDGNKAYQCEKCGQKFTLLSNFRRHLRHNKTCGTSQKEFKCPNCLKVFSLNSTMKDHYERCTAEDPYRFMCPNCPKLFTFKSSLNKHLRGRCRFIKQLSNTKMEFKCQFCPAEFHNRNALTKHLNNGKCISKNDINNFICSYCANNFTLKTSLNKHLKDRCKVLHPKNSKDVLSKFEVIVEEVDDSVTTYEIIHEDDVIEECTDWESYDTDDVNPLVEVINESDNEDPKVGVISNEISHKLM